MTADVESGFMHSHPKVRAVLETRLCTLLTPIALQEYDRRVNVHATHLESLISALDAGNGSVNVTQIFHWFSIDVMGDLTFSKSFRMLENGEAHAIAGLLHDSMDILGVLSPAPWLVRLGLDLLPSHPAVKKWNSLVNLSRALMSERREVSRRFY